MLKPSHSKIYDEIGTGYHSHRVADVRIAKAIRAALGNSTTVCNVGAGAGSYEPLDLDVVAVEPSTKMIAQRENSFPVVQSSAERLPFSTKSFDTSMAVLTIHHWTNPIKGLLELKRVSSKQVIFTFDPEMLDAFWLVRDYFPDVIECDKKRSVAISTIQDSLDVQSVNIIRVPWDCTDGFQAAYWRRPEFYLLPEVRNAISTFAQMPRATVDQGIGELADDIKSGRWHKRYAEMLNENEMDFGYRLIIAGQDSE